MSGKSLVMLGFIIGSVVGGYLPELFGIGSISMTGVITSAVGGVIGIYIAFKLSSDM